LQERPIFQLIGTVFLIWTLLLIFIGVMKMNEYSFIATIGRCLLGVFLMLVIWAVLLLLYGLFDQLYNFIEGIITEFRLSILQ
jgi:uncharacterized membrane protein